MYDEFTELDTVVIAVAQEDKNLKTHAQFLKNFGDGPPFDIVADIKRKKTPRYDRTTAYLIDKKGVVRQIFWAHVYCFVSIGLLVALQLWIGRTTGDRGGSESEA